MEIKITLKGKPRSTNNLYKTVCRGNFPTRYMSTEAKALKEDYQWQAKSQYKGKLHVNPLSVEIKIYHPTRRKNDIDNFNKVAIDALTGIVWKDDDQIEKLSLEKYYDKEDPRMDILIKRI